MALQGRIGLYRALWVRVLQGFVRGFTGSNSSDLSVDKRGAAYPPDPLPQRRDWKPTATGRNLDACAMAHHAIALSQHGVGTINGDCHGE